MKHSHEQVIALRDTNLSYKEISLRLGISKGTISYICNKKIPKDVHEQQILSNKDSWYSYRNDHMENMRSAAASHYTKIREDLGKKYLNLLKEYGNQPFVSYVLGLYSGEGTHSPNPSTRSQCAISNSDYKIIESFMNLVINVLNLDRSRMSVVLRLHLSMDTEVCKSYWESNGIVIDKIYQIDNRLQKKSYMHNAYREYHGTIQVKVKQPNGIRWAFNKYIESIM